MFLSVRALYETTKALKPLQEAVYCLEETNRELKTELKIQKRKTKEMEELKDSLTKELLLYRYVNFDLFRIKWIPSQITQNSVLNKCTVALMKTFFLQGCH